MKSVDKKDMPKLIALIGLAVCAFGYGIYSLTGGGGAGAQPPATPEQKKDDTKHVDPAVQAEAQGDDLRIKMLIALNKPVIGRDPFAPTANPDGNPTPAPPAPTPGPPLANTNTPAVNTALTKTGGPRSPFDLGAFLRQPGGSALGKVGDLKVNPAGGTGPVVVPSPAPPSFSVAGVVVGEGSGDAVAILRNGEERRYVSVGDEVGNGFVVRSIRRGDRGGELEIEDSRNRKRRMVLRPN